MMKKSSLNSVPSRSDRISWYCSEDGGITIKLYNRGICNRVCQKLLRYPKTTCIYLDKIGSEVWVLLDGRRTVMEIGERISQKYGEDAEPLYERLMLYIKALHSNKMVRISKPENPYRQ